MHSIVKNSIPHFEAFRGFLIRKELHCLLFTEAPNRNRVSVCVKEAWGPPRPPSLGPAGDWPALVSASPPSRPLSPPETPPTLNRWPDCPGFLSFHTRTPPPTLKVNCKWRRKVATCHLCNLGKDFEKSGTCDCPGLSDVPALNQPLFFGLLQVGGPSVMTSSTKPDSHGGRSGDPRRGPSPCGTCATTPAAWWAPTARVVCWNGRGCPRGDSPHRPSWVV